MNMLSYIWRTRFVVQENTEALQQCKIHCEGQSLKTKPTPILTLVFKRNQFSCQRVQNLKCSLGGVISKD